MLSENIFKAKADCCICTEIRDEIFPEPYQEKYEISRRSCAENQDFVAVPSVSPLMAGHLLLFPKKHVTSLAQLNLVCLQSFLSLAEHLATRISDHFDTPYFFEHGVPKEGSGGCGINHAHLHLLPLPKTVASGVTERVSKEYPQARSGNLVQMLSTNTSKFHYLLYGLQLENLRLSFSPHIPSQYMRRLIAEETGLTSWDWRELSGVNQFQRTMKEINTTEMVVK